MPDASRWTVRAGALLLLLSPLVPQTEIGGASFSPWRLAGRLEVLSSAVAQRGVEAWLFLPAAAGAVLLAAVGRRTAPGPASRVLSLALLMAVCFSLATIGSILLTETGSAGPGPSTSFALSLAMFLLPLLLGGVALARSVGGEGGRSSGGFVRLSIGLLVALQGAFLLDGGWDLLLSLIKQIGIPHARAGAWMVPAGGLLVAAGELLPRLRPRAAVDTAPASG